MRRFTTSICDVNVSSRAPVDVGSRQARIGNLDIDSKPHCPSAIESNSIGASGVWCGEQGSQSALLELGDLPGPTRKPLVPWIAAERHSAPRSKPSRRFWPLQSAGESAKNGAPHAGNGPQPGLGWCAAPQLRWTSEGNTPATRNGAGMVPGAPSTATKSGTSKRSINLHGGRIRCICCNNGCVC